MNFKSSSIVIYLVVNVSDGGRSFILYVHMTVIITFRFTGFHVIITELFTSLLQQIPSSLRDPFPDMSTFVILSRKTQTKEPNETEHRLGRKTCNHAIWESV